MNTTILINKEIQIKLKERKGTLSYSQYIDKLLDDESLSDKLNRILGCVVLR